MSKRKHHRPEFKAKVALAKLKGVSRRLTGFGAETAYSPLTRGRRIASVHHRKSSLKYVAVCRSTMFMSRKLLDRRARSTLRVRNRPVVDFSRTKPFRRPKKTLQGVIHDEMRFRSAVSCPTTVSFPRSTKSFARTGPGTCGAVTASGRLPFGIHENGEISYRSGGASSPVSLPGRHIRRGSRIRQHRRMV